MPGQHSKKSERAKAASDAAKQAIEEVKSEDLFALQKFGKKLSHPKVHWSHIFQIDFIATYALVIFVCSLLFIGIGILAVDLVGNLKERKEIEKDRAVLMKEKKQWERVIAAYPDYRDGYFKLGTINYQLGNIESARINVKKMLELDPNFEPGRELEKVLGQ